MLTPRVRAARDRVEAGIAAVKLLPPRAALAREMRRIRRFEVFTSTAMAGSRLEPEEVDALLDGGLAIGNHAFADYVLVRGYADAAQFVSDLRPLGAGTRGPLIGIEEVRQLNARATAGSGSRGGAWRLGNPAPQAGVVAPAAWLVAREVTTLLDRYARGPRDDPLAVWLARFLGRFARLVPFEAGNGRTARLAANLMLRRLDIVPIVFEQRERARFAGTLTAAETGAPEPLADLIATAIVRTCNRLSAAVTESEDAVIPLRAAAGDAYPALAKAAQRGRLRTIVRGGRYYTTAGWIAEYQERQRSRRVTRPTEPPA